MPNTFDVQFWTSAKASTVVDFRERYRNTSGEQARCSPLEVLVDCACPAREGITAAQ